MPAVIEHEAARGNAQRTVRLDVAYRGTGFRGFAANEGVRTVAGELSAALERILSEAPVLTVAGRTDAGVHATGQVVSFRIGGEGLRRLVGSHARQRPAVLTEPDHPADGADQGASDAASLPRLASSLNGALNPDIAVTAAAFAADSFDARRSAVGRAYEYGVRNTALFDPRYADLEWHVAAPLDLGEMNSAAQHFVGEHDFTSFCRRPKGRPDASLVRTVTRARWQAAAAPSGAVQQAQQGQHGPQAARQIHVGSSLPSGFSSEPGGRQLCFEVEANAFCHQMVRAIVGHCVAVGRGDRSADDVPAVLAARSRDAAAPIAPPHGLTLVAVRYPNGAP